MREGVILGFQVWDGGGVEVFRDVRRGRDGAFFISSVAEYGFLWNDPNIDYTATSKYQLCNAK